MGELRSNPCGTPSARRVGVRRVMWCLCAAVLAVRLGTAPLLKRWVSSVSERYGVIRHVDRCMECAMPGNLIAFTERAEDISDLARLHTLAGHYYKKSWGHLGEDSGRGFVMYHAWDLDDLAGLIPLPPAEPRAPPRDWVVVRSGGDTGTMFLHERTTAKNVRRLVLVRSRPRRSHVGPVRRADWAIR